jgi:ribosomal protein L37AE/L43A
VKKDGIRNGRQKYKCLACGSYFSAKRKKNPVWIGQAYKDYSAHKQTYKELSKKYEKSHKTLRKYFDGYAAVTGELKPINKPVVLILDATFFGRGYGILLARTPLKVLIWKEIVSETIQVYASFLDDLEAAGYTFSGFVIDGRRGVRKLLERRFPQASIQFCQFHQIQIVKRYIPKRAKTEAARSLRRIALRIARISRVEFEQSLDDWHLLYENFLNEKSPSEGRRTWCYTHGRLRSAYRSLRTNLPYLFTCQNKPNLKMPNTTNHCDGLFSHIKQKILIHRGISKRRRKKMIDYLLENF